MELLLLFDIKILSLKNNLKSDFNTLIEVRIVKQYDIIDFKGKKDIPLGFYTYKDLITNYRIPNLTKMYLQLKG